MRAFQSLARFRLRITSHFSPSHPWCTGEDSNLRSSKERQIYSLLPLTARPPVPRHPADKLCRRELRPTLPALSSPMRLSSKTQPSAHRLPSGNLRQIGACTSSGITAKDRSGVQKIRSPANSTRFRLRLPVYLFVELAKGFEPPTL